MSHAKIQNVIAREILDSRGLPTVEVDIILDSGIMARASVPSGASTGSNEAVELRDNNNARFFGKGVTQAVYNVNNIIKPRILGFEIANQNMLDSLLIDLDGTPNKSHLGANAILAVSIAYAIASSEALKIPLYEYINPHNLHILPVPMMNVINGGKHANNNLDIQEFMIVPVNMRSFKEALRCGSEIFYTLKQICHERSYSTSVGDEGGFAPNLASHEDAIKLIIEAIERAGYVAGVDVYIALDCAASEFYYDGKYHLRADNLTLNSEEFTTYLDNLCNLYPIISIEDAISELDYTGWIHITKNMGHKIQLVGDDIFVTNATILKKCIHDGIANSLLVKVNQIGTLTETMHAVNMAHNANYTTVISHRSGETESTVIADLAVAFNCGQIKTGSLSRTDRICKYNQLLRIEEFLGNSAKYLGLSAFKIK